MERELYQKIVFYIERDVKGGFETKQQIIDATVGNISNIYQDDNLEAIVKRITIEKLNSHYDEQSTWDYPTDCDKLDQAFAELESSGILARQHYYCCGTCGYCALESELKENKKARGGTFYHEQDT